MTVKEFLEESSVFAGVSGFDPSSKKALEFLNRARRLLWNRGDYESLIEYGKVYVNGNHFWLPYHLETIRSVHFFSSGSQLKLRGKYYEEISSKMIVDLCGEEALTSNSCLNTRKGNTYAFPYAGDCKDTQISFCKNDFLDLEPITIRLDGIDYGGSFVVEEIQLTESGVAVSSKHRWKSFHKIIKPRTVGEVTSVLTDSSDSTVLATHHFSPFEDVCKYPVYIMDGTVSPDFLIGVFKKRYINITDKDYDRELGLNPDALEFAMTAASMKRLNDIPGYTANLQLAEEHLEEEQQDKDSKDLVTSTFYPSIA